MDVERQRVRLLGDCLARLTDTEIDELKLLMLSARERAALSKPLSKVNLLSDLENIGKLGDLEKELRANKIWGKRLENYLRQLEGL